MDKDKSKILILVEGAKTDVRLMKHLMQLYNIDIKYEMVSYNTNIYTLYDAMFAEGDPDSMDILQILKERELDPQKKQIFNERYTDILLIFDFDPQDPLFSKEKITEMMEYFVESSDVGKLYLNYPMVEAFYHMKSIPDESYNSCCVSMSELKDHTYKQRVNRENRNHDYSKFANSRKECNIVILQNIEKAWHILGNYDYIDDILPDSIEILMSQLDKLHQEDTVFVLCTCVFFIPNYDPKLIKE
ncbi:MAG TPA: hypothetical protein VF941_06075 [Clostridia bacterium]